MKTQFFICLKSHSSAASCLLALVLMFGAFATSAQTGDYLYSGTEDTIILNPGLYDITAFGAQGGSGYNSSPGGLGAEMEGQFDFTTMTTLTLLVGGVGGSSYVGGGGGGSFVVDGSTPLVVADGGGGAGYGINGYTGQTEPSGSSGADGGGGGSGGSGGGSAQDGGGGGGGFSGNGITGLGGGGISFLNGDLGGSGSGFGGSGGYGGGGGGYSGGLAPDIQGGGGGGGYSGGGGGGYLFGGGGGGSYVDSSAIEDLTEISGIASPDDSPNGEILIMAVPEPGTWALAGLGGLSLLLFRGHQA